MLNSPREQEPFFGTSSVVRIGLVYYGSLTQLSSQRGRGNARQSTQKKQCCPAKRKVATWCVSVIKPERPQIKCPVILLYKVLCLRGWRAVDVWIWRSINDPQMQCIGLPHDVVAVLYNLHLVRREVFCALLWSARLETSAYYFVMVRKIPRMWTNVRCFWQEAKKQLPPFGDRKRWATLFARESFWRKFRIHDYTVLHPAIKICRLGE
jgi:hypothetical protein